MKSWKVGWFELLADGKLSWFPSPSKLPHENRCTSTPRNQIAYVHSNMCSVCRFACRRLQDRLFADLNFQPVRASNGRITLAKVT